MNIDNFTEFYRGITSRLRRLVIGTYLFVVCYAGIFAVVLCALSAYQVLAVAKKLSDDMDSRSPTSLIQDAARLGSLRDRQEELRSEIKGISTEISEHERKFESAYQRYYSILDPIVTRAGIEAAELLESADYRRIEQDVLAGLTGTSAADADSNLFATTLQAFEAWYAQQIGSDDLDNLHSLNNSFATQKAELDRISQDINSLRTQGEGEIEIVSIELRSLQPYFHFLATQPESVLVFILIIAMGALGSTIHITQAFLTGDVNRPLAWYLVRPLLGIVTAVAIYILAKAGQLVLDPSKSAGTMSPWFISFLAVVSGLLSDAAIQRISRAGQRIFEPDDEFDVPRWGVNLPAKLTASNVDKQKLSMALGVTEEKLESFVECIDPVPQYEQEIIAAWLRLPLREVFSDVEPAT